MMLLEDDVEALAAPRSWRAWLIGDRRGILSLVPGDTSAGAARLRNLRRIQTAFAGQVRTRPNQTCSRIA
jgi:hypothetical protein